MMSFFVRKNNQPDKMKGKNRKRKLPPKYQDEELSSSEEETTRRKVRDKSSSEDEGETPQDKKLRLAKLYLAEIENREKNRLEATGEPIEDVTSDDINKVLREDYLQTIGKLRYSVAAKYVGADLTNITVLKCKFHKKSITCLCVTLDGKFIFSGSKDGSIVKWSLEQMKRVDAVRFVESNPQGVFNGHSKGITGIAVSHDMKHLAVSDETKDIQIWNPDNLQHVKTLTGHRSTVTDVVFCRDSYVLYSCSTDKSVKLWSLDEVAYMETLFGHQSAITSIDGLFRDRAVTSGRDTTIRIWKINVESQLIYNGHVGSIDVVKLINNDHFVSGGDDGKLCIWSVNRKKPLCVIPRAHGQNDETPQPYWISAIACHVNTDLIATGSHCGFIKVWQLKDSCRSCERLFEIPVTGFVNSLAFTPDGMRLIAGVGREHKFGRWTVVGNAKISVLVIPLVKAD